MRYFVPCAVLLLSLASAQAQVQPPLFYYGFEPGKDPGPAWENTPLDGEAKFSVPAKGSDGGYCLAVETQEGSGVWTVRLPVSAKSVYRLSGAIRTDDVKISKGERVGASLQVRNFVGLGTAPITGSADWQDVSVTFDSGDLTDIEVECLLLGGKGSATGTAYFDNIRLEHLSQDNLYPAIRVHGDETATPISPYIYSQFIEHLGRCIYGGIWAEILEDRKFFYGVGDKDSPWTAIGEGAVAMSKDDPFVGEHSPVVTLAPEAAHGIVQGGLALVAKKDYEGYVYLAGKGEAEVALVWGDGVTERVAQKISGIGEKYRKYPSKFSAGASTDDGRLEISAKGTGTLKIGTVSLMPADNVDGMRADTLAVLKELKAPVYRWPGGNFVSGYDWHDGIGERDKRPPRKNPAWKGVEHNDFGADEYQRFLKELGADGYLVVNSGLGGVDAAVEEVQYHVGAASTPGGKLRAANGHRAPYALKFIGIGNEMYGDWQLGHMPLSDYVKKHNEFAEAIEKEAGKVTLVAVGATGNWSETMLKECSGHMGLLSEHFYCGAKPELISHVLQIPDNIRGKVIAQQSYHEQLAELKDKHIPICMDEWNYWYGPHVYGELGTQYYLKDALGIAEGLNAFYAASDWVFMANYAQTVNVIGCVKTSKTAACLDTTGVVLALYRKQFGSLPITLEGNPFPVDISAAWTTNKDEITFSVVNPTHETYDVALGVDGMNLPRGGKRWIVTGGDPQAKNVPGKDPEVTVKEEDISGVVKSLPAPPLSAVVYRLKVE